MACYITNFQHTARGVARIFQGRGGGGSVCQSEGTCQIVMSFSPPIVGWFLKKNLTKGGSHAPQDPPGYALYTAFTFDEMEQYGVNPEESVTARDEDYQVHIDPPTFTPTEEQRMQLPDPFQRSEQLP